MILEICYVYVREITLVHVTICIFILLKRQEKYLWQMVWYICENITLLNIVRNLTVEKIINKGFTIGCPMSWSANAY